MVTLVFCLRRKPGLSQDAFLSYWRERHGPLVRECLPAIGALWYRQMAGLAGGLAAAVTQSRGGPQAYDGVALLGWADTAAFAEAGRSAAGREAARRLLEDEARFIDLANSPLFLTEEQFFAAPADAPEA